MDLQHFVAAPLLRSTVWSEPQNCVWEYCSHRSRNGGTEMSLLARARCCLCIMMARVCGNSLEFILTFILSQAAAIISTKRLCLRRVCEVRSVLVAIGLDDQVNHQHEHVVLLVGLVWQRHGEAEIPFHRDYLSALPICVPTLEFSILQSFWASGAAFKRLSCSQEKGFAWAIVSTVD